MAETNTNDIQSMDEALKKFQEYMEAKKKVDEEFDNELNQHLDYLERVQSGEVMTTYKDFAKKKKTSGGDFSIQTLVLSVTGAAIGGLVVGYLIKRSMGGSSSSSSKPERFRKK